MSARPFDRYADGDPYEDERYIENFRMILRAIREKCSLRVRFRGHSGIRHSFVCVPYRLEYSAKDDKFRLLALGDHQDHIINLARICSCELLQERGAEKLRQPRERSCELTMLLHDERNGVERVLLHFSHFEKQTRWLEEGLYQIRLRYDKDDETELLIRVLSFGPVLEVVAPDTFAELIRERLRKQNALMAQTQRKKQKRHPSSVCAGIPLVACGGEC